MNRTKNQIRHYLLSFPDSVLIDWYNNQIVEAFGDFSEQVIRLNTPEAQNYIKSALDLEVILQAARDENTNYSAGEKYFCLTGGTRPYFVSFDTFEQFLYTESGKALIGWLAGSEDDLEAISDFVKD